MIDWELTKQQLNRTDLSGRRPQVVVRCDTCQQTAVVRISKKSKVIDGYYPWQCNKCIANRPEKRAKSSAGAKKGWQDPEYRKTVTENSQRIWEDSDRARAMSAFRDSPDFKDRMLEINREKAKDENYRQNISRAKRGWWADMTPQQRQEMSQIFSANSKVIWQNPEYRAKIEKITLENWRNAEYRQMMVNSMVDKWKDPEHRVKMLGVFASNSFRETMSKTNKEVWARPGYREKMTPILANIRGNVPTVSSLQNILYSILDDLGVKYYREYNDKPNDPQCLIGPWGFDCVVPRDGKPTLLIEVQGDYWHSRPGTIRSDKAKASYIGNNFAGVYELKYIWEHEFSNYHKIMELVKYWLGIITDEAVMYNFDNLNIRECPAADYRLLLSKYHYLANAGRGGIAYGAYLGDILIAVCVFSPPIRQNIDTGDYSHDETCELSRLCIHPKYQMHNLASWFVSRCLKQLPKKYKLIISYCDTTFGHDGATYKACNFKLDREIVPDYWYLSTDGWIMHKRTLYRHAVRMKMKEAEYATLNGYQKVWGDKKLRFIYER